MSARILVGSLLLVESLVCGAASDRPWSGDASYRGWKSICLSNGLVELHVVPEIGGRIIQFKLGAKEFLWVNPQLAGQAPPLSGLGSEGEWLNYGGDKLWPAPQGWQNDEQWPGPPDAVLDGQPYRLEKLRERNGEAAFRVTSGRDQRSGIQFSRVVRVFEGSTRVSFEATMRNIDVRPRRWGIWAHTQLDAAAAYGTGPNQLVKAWCPLNPQSRFPKGYRVIFGEENNPSFQPDRVRNLMRVQYQYRVGKVGLDSHAGWVATVDGTSGAVFAQRFTFAPGREYPDGSSVEFWLNGPGKIHAYNKDIEMPTNAVENPYVFESEVLSPFAKLQPGESYTWRYDWFACNLGGDFPVVDCTTAGVTSEPLRTRLDGELLKLEGRFGVFAPGALQVVFRNAQGGEISRQALKTTVSPLQPVLVRDSVMLPSRAVGVALVLVDQVGRTAGELTQVTLARP